MLRKNKNLLRVIFLLAIGMTLFAWLTEPVMADEIVWEYWVYRPHSAKRLSNSNTLITDWNHRVIEVTPDGTIVWECNGFNRPVDAERLLNGNTLIADREDHRVIEVTPDCTIVWEYSTEQYRTRGANRNRTLNGNTLIASSGGVIEVTPDCTIVWEYGGIIFDAERLSNGNTLITKYYDNRIIEVTPDSTTVWEYTVSSEPYDAERLSNGNTLITNYGNNRIIEVTPDGTIVWEYIGLSSPCDAERLSNGNTLIADQNNNRIIEVGPPLTVSVPDTTFGAAGDTVTIPVYTEDLTGLGVVSAEFDLTYDSNILTGIDVDTSGTLLSGTDWTCEYNVVGDTFYVALIGADTLAGSGALIKLIFVVSPDAQPGQESPLHFAYFLFNEGNLAVTTQDGIFIVISVGVEDSTSIPKMFAFSQNYPNPFSASGRKGKDQQTTISYALPKSCKVFLMIYNIKGQLVETLVNDFQQAGYYSVVWNSEDARSGIYLYRITAGDFTDTKKCVILK